MRHLTEIGEPLVLVEARKDLGIREGKDDKRIVAMHQHTGLRAQSSKVPWCSAAVCAWFEQIGIRSTRRATAASWKTWGVECEPRPGAVIIFGKHDPDAAGTGHVGIVVDWPQGGWVEVISGNQNNAVTLKQYPLTQAVSVRWPDHR